MTGLRRRSTERVEDALADLLEDNPDLFAELCSDGRRSLAPEKARRGRAIVRPPGQPPRIPTQDEASDGERARFVD